MGSQIQIAHAAEDERLANEQLARRGDFLCLPRFFESRDEQPVTLGECEADDQVVFPAGSRDAVLRHVVLVADSSGRFHVYPKDGLCIEWTRTARVGATYVPGRYFFSPDATATSQTLEKALAGLVSWIKTSHPMKTSGRFPIFVGPALWKLVKAGTVSLAYRSGKPLELRQDG